MFMTREPRSGTHKGCPYGCMVLWAIAPVGVGLVPTPVYRTSPTPNPR